MTVELGAFCLILALMLSLLQTGASAAGRIRGEAVLRGTGEGASLAAYLKSMTALMVSEGDRRRAGIELKRTAGPVEDEPDDPKVTSIAKYKEKLGVA